MDIQININKHDNFQLEFKTVYPINSGHKESEYNTDVFFFVPHSLAVNEYTFSGREFYNDFSEYIRFKTPDFKLSLLIDRDNPALVKLRRVVEELPSDGTEFKQYLKMFCSILKSSLRDSAAAVKNTPQEEMKTMLLSYIEHTEKVLSLFREIRENLQKFPEEMAHFELADEFLSLTVNRYLYDLWDFWTKKYPDTDECSQKLVKATYREIQYRRKNKYPAVPEEGSDNSELLYRESTLKKSLANILFLNVETRRDGIMLENICMAFAAAVAMIFVTAIAFLWQGLYLEEFSVSFFAVWVIAYMFKDRIKSQLQIYFLSRRSRYSYDYRQKIFDGFGNEIGVFREGFRHCSDKEIDEKILKVRNRTHISRLVNGSQKENVILYRKKIELMSDPCKDIFREFNVEGVVNIYRLNIRHWLNKMDNPSREIFCSDGETIKPLNVRRDYHINIVLRIGGKNCKEKYVRYRLILCRDGIRNIQKF